MTTIFMHFSLFSAKKVKFIRLYTLFHLKEANILSSKSASLLLQSKLVQRKWLRF